MAMTDMQKKKNGKKYKKVTKVRWGRLIVLLVLILALITTVFWGSVWVYKEILSDKGQQTVAADANIKENEALNRRINVLLLGIDDGDSEAQATEPKRSDAMMLVSFDPEDNKVAIVSMPRDTMVRLPGHRNFSKINSAYAEGGAAMAKQTVANLLRIPIHYYALLNWQGFIDVVNLLGGVDIYVDRDMYYVDPYANLKIDIKQGHQHLDGEKSGQYVRFRKDELGDIGRVQRQQKFMKALGLQFFTINNLTKIPKILSTIDSHIETDMNTGTLIKAARSFNLIGDNNIKSLMLYGGFYDSPRSGISYWRSDRKDIEKTLKELDIPFLETKGKILANDPVAGVDSLPPSTNTEAGRKFLAAQKAAAAKKAAEAAEKAEAEKKKALLQEAKSGKKTTELKKSNKKTESSIKTSRKTNIKWDKKKSDKQ